MTYDPFRGYDAWKTRSPDDEELGPESDEPELDWPDGVDPQSFAPEARAEHETEFTRSGNRFPAYDQALLYLANLALQYPWMRTRVVPSADLPNCEWINGRLAPLKPGDVA